MSYSETGEGIRDSRVIYQDGDMIMEAFMISDDDMSEPDGDCYSAEDYDAFHAGEWEYVIVRVVVRFQGVEIGWDNLGAVHHGTMGDGHEEDAFEWMPARHDTHAIVQGSPLWSVAEQAVDQAWRFSWALTGESVTAIDSPIRRLLRTIQPIVPSEIRKAHAAALVEDREREVIISGRELDKAARAVERGR